MELIHGGDLYGCPAGTIDFSASLNPLGMPEPVREALCTTAGLWSAYPDPLCRTLTAELSRHEAVPRQWILCGNGAADLLFRVAFAQRPKRAMVLAPGFAEYENALNAAGCEVGFHTLHEKDGFALTEKLLGQLSPALDMLVLCNPNNPTGQPIERELMQRVLKKCAEYGIRLLVDECFTPFLDNPEEYTMKPALDGAKHLMILKAFTKTYAMAGLRLGYLLCSDEAALEAAAACGQPWSVSAPAQIAGVAALSDAGYRERTALTVAAGRAYLTQELKKLRLTVIGSQANFIFFKCNSHRDLKERLLERGIMIRSCGNFRGLDERFYRVAVRTEQENRKLVEALAGILGLAGQNG